MAKIRFDFVTNSSAASFTLFKECLTQDQINLIHDHINVGVMLFKEKGKTCYTDEWQITETDTEIGGYTSMDNFDMFWFLDEIGVKDEYFKERWHS